MTHFSPTRRSFDLSGSAASGLAATPAGQPGAEVGGRQRLGDEIALGDIAAQPGGTIPGGAGLDALGHRGHAELAGEANRSEEHTSELQSLMRISYAVFCLKKKNKQQRKNKT